MNLYNLQIMLTDEEHRDVQSAETWDPYHIYFGRAKFEKVLSVEYKHPIILCHAHYENTAGDDRGPENGRGLSVLLNQHH